MYIFTLNKDKTETEKLNIRGSFCKTRKEYKKLIKLKKREWTNNLIAKLEDIEAKDPKEYWKIVNELRENKKSETSFNTKTFTNFFQDLFSADKTKNETIYDENIEKFVNENLEKIQEADEPDFTMKELLFAIKWMKKIRQLVLMEFQLSCSKHFLSIFSKSC